MGILTRFKDIMSANINALLDKCEDPEKMIDQYMRNLESDLGKVKAETASVMAEETRAKRELDECTEQVNKMQSYAEKALTAGNEADARKFLEKKQQLVSTQTALQQSYEAAAANAAKMRQMHDKLVKDIESLESRKAAIKAKVATAKAQERLNSIGSSVTGANNSMAAFSKMEAKANIMDYDGTLDMPDTLLEKMDIVIASFHIPCICPGTKEQNTQALVQVLENPLVDIIGHPDDSRYPVDFETVVRAAKQNNKFLELNNTSLKPDGPRSGARENDLCMLKLCMEHGVMITLGSDAHVEEDICNFSYAEELLKEVHFPDQLIANLDLDRFTALL